MVEVLIRCSGGGDGGREVKIEMMEVEVMKMAEMAEAEVEEGVACKSNLTVLRRILHLDLAKGNPK
jgi:hypothetical protein